MAVDRIRVMISSRCKDYVTADKAYFPLSGLRKSLQAEINAAELFGRPLFECWINEVEPSKAATRDLWDECVREIRRAHIVIVLYNGDAGWAREANDIGICHAELEASLLSGRDRTHLIQFPASEASSQRDRRFQGFVDRELTFSGPPAQNEDDAAENVRSTLVEAVARLARSGATMLRRESYALGQALEWSKLDYAARKLAMESACLDALAERQGRMRDKTLETTAVCVRIDKSDVLFFAHAIPAAASVAAARELVGKPFLTDHRYVTDENRVCGPVHLIPCQKSTTEKQATDLLGFPDATVVTTTFGVYLVDPIQQIQFILLANCRDETSTRFAVQRLFDCKRAFYCTGCARGWPRRRVAPGPSGIIGTA
ncbi:DUF4062 domain-containing protein [Bradyrhizobium septentrionale]|uniref:hypothetical protein n=1 Tax=Bradyrhizobium septentrionale TaxID=1404411 RepID=UPI0015967CF5|nr:hypothetical protein [Bradyrhizobium septentrionale]UGY26647.1 DUF4062 domain-containing protein [Bradyrhizobium septentrionale]